ncbi:MAG: NERD domain-containing protein [Clostridia bacterium]|nr:NERD domain-containing protein [Clostridia bacterium]
MAGLEKFFNFLIVVSSIALAAVVIYMVVTYFVRKKQTEKLKSQKRRGPDYVPKLIKIYRPSSRIVRNAVLPEPLEDGTFGRAEADLIYIDGCGIVVMSLCPVSGAVDNPKEGPWTVTNPKITVTLDNPLERTAAATRAIAALLKDEEVYNVPIYNVAVFYGRKTVFRNKSNQSLNSDTLISTLNDINRDRFLRRAEISATYNAIKKHMEKQPVEQ